jgi:hypothetical protein
MRFFARADEGVLFCFTQESPLMFPFATNEVVLLLSFGVLLLNRLPDAVLMFGVTVSEIRPVNRNMNEKLAE